MFNSPNKSVGVIKGAPPQGKNLIINGNLTVDQRGVYTEYVADRWKIVDANNMTQIIEDKNFEPSTEYTLSWEGGTPQQITSPASGHWTLPNIPRTARKIQLEKGDEATEFEWEDYGTTLAKCQRYFYRIVGRASGYKHNGYILANFSVPQFRDIPVITVIDFGGYESSNNGARANYTPSNLSQGIYDHGGRGITLRLQGGTWSSFVPTDGSGIWGSGIYFADAEL